MHKYEDENILQKVYFVSNIPYMRGLEIKTLKSVTYLIKSQVYEQGDLILDSSQVNNKIMIIWEGQV